MNNQLKEIKNNFLLFNNQLDIFEYLFELGKDNKGLSDNHKIDQNLIIGCASKNVNPSAIANSFHTQIPLRIAVATIPGIIKGRYIL